MIVIADRLKSCLRGEDIVARLGGDEFIVLLEDVESLENVKEVARRIVEDLHRPLVVEGHEISTSASVGIVFNNHHTDAEGMLRDADIAMYRAKMNGKNRFEIFEEYQREDTIVRTKLEYDLRHALENREFGLYYQPIYELDSGRVTGLEALLRWNHPVHGMIDPLRFIPIAEEIELIIAIGDWVLAEACKQMAAWQVIFPQPSPLEISVNISPRQLKHVDFQAHIRQVLEETHLSAGSLALEITENAVMENFDTARSVLHNLEEDGVQIHIDDFGTGYSSLGRLQSFPIHTIKIDRVFIHEIEHENGSAGIVRAITNMGKELGVKIVAEGIETLHELEYLKSLGCSAGQGYYLAKPMQAGEVERLLQAAFVS